MAPGDIPGYTPAFHRQLSPQPSFHMHPAFRKTSGCVCSKIFKWPKPWPSMDHLADTAGRHEWQPTEPKHLYSNLYSKVVRPKIKKLPILRSSILAIFCKSLGVLDYIYICFIHLYISLYDIQGQSRMSCTARDVIISGMPGHKVRAPKSCRKCNYLANFELTLWECNIANGESPFFDR